jgi:hypothetical protein
MSPFINIDIPIKSIYNRNSAEELENFVTRIRQICGDVIFDSKNESMCKNRTNVTDKLKVLIKELKTEIDNLKIQLNQQQQQISQQYQREINDLKIQHELEREKDKIIINDLKKKLESEKNKNKINTAYMVLTLTDDF